MKNRLFPVVILAGGLATRLHPVTHTIPKSLVEVNGEPFVAHQLRLLKRNGFNKVIMCIGHLGQNVIEFVGDGSCFGLHVSYSLDGQTLLGTAGAIKKALPLLEKYFFVLYGDSYLPCDYLSVQNYFSTSKKLALMTVFNNKGKWDNSNVEFHQNEIISHNKAKQTRKMHYIDYGLGVFSKEIFENLFPTFPPELSELYQALLQQKELAAFEIKARFYEVGSFFGIHELSQYLSDSQTFNEA